jgi:hypothetical protein
MTREKFSNGEIRPGAWGPMHHGVAKAEGTLGGSVPCLLALVLLPVLVPLGLLRRNRAA